MKATILLIALFLTLSACKKEEVDSFETIMRVNYYRQTCQGEGELNCYLTQEGKQMGTNSWGLFYSDIEGFQYEEGFVYTLKVRVEKVANPPADGADRKYILMEVVSQEKV